MQLAAAHLQPQLLMANMFGAYLNNPYLIDPAGFFFFFFAFFFAIVFSFFIFFFSFFFCSFAFFFFFFLPFFSPFSFHCSFLFFSFIFAPLRSSFENKNVVLGLALFSLVPKSEPCPSTPLVHAHLLGHNAFSIYFNESQTLNSPTYCCICNILLHSDMKLRTLRRSRVGRLGRGLPSPVLLNCTIMSNARNLGKCGERNRISISMNKG